MEQALNAKMNILLLTGSPRREGTSAWLADHFQGGAAAAGHDITRFDTAFMQLEGCRGCGHCRQVSGVCIIKDDYAPIQRLLLEADLVAFVTPLYFFDMTSQLKKVLDRFYMVSPQLREMPSKQAVMLATCGIPRDWPFNTLKLHYQALLRYLKWKDAGQIYVSGVVNREDITASAWGEQARQLGLSLSDSLGHKNTSLLTD
jgi:multimeric flavodoxin WrbA